MLWFVVVDAAQPAVADDPRRVVAPRRVGECKPRTDDDGCHGFRTTLMHSSCLSRKVK